jgi:hypothetical protein
MWHGASLLVNRYSLPIYERAHYVGRGGHHEEGEDLVRGQHRVAP